MNSKSLTAIVVASALLFYLGKPLPAFAASGGRISGGSFRSAPSRSYSAPPRSLPGGRYRSVSPSLSRPLYPSTRRTYVSPGSGSTNIIFLPDLSPRPVSPRPSAEVESASYSPLGGLTLLFFLGATGVAIFLVLGGWDDFLAPFLERQKEKFRKISVAKVQVALLASAKDIQQDLEKLARKGTLTETKYGLKKILSETSLALLRNPDKTVYARSEWIRRSASTAEELYNRISIEERSKLSQEVLTNNEGQITEKNKEGLSEDTGEYILVSILVAYAPEVALPTVNSPETLKEALSKLGSLQPSDLVALEILWQPEGKNEVLSQEELLSLYPQLNRL